jgi:hypothetical protein
MEVMKSASQHIIELLKSNRFIEEPRDKNKNSVPPYEDWELDGCPITGGDQDEGNRTEDPVEGEQEKDLSNPLRRGDNSTII